VANKISNAEQLRIYDEEKRKVWDLQSKSLSNPVPPVLTEQDELRSAAPVTGAGIGPRFIRQASGRRSISRGYSKTATPFGGDSRGGSPSMSELDGESAWTGNQFSGKVMRIRRVVKGKTHVDIIRDPAVIQSYLRHIEDRKIDAYVKSAEDLQPTGDPEEDRLRAEAIERRMSQMQKNQQRRVQRKRYLANSLGELGENPDSNRRCGACGQMGHTKANRNCPMFNANSVGPSPIGTSSAGPTPSGYTPGGFTPGGFTPSAFTPAGFTPIGMPTGGFTPAGYGAGGTAGYFGPQHGPGASTFTGEPSMFVESPADSTGGTKLKFKLGKSQKRP